MKDVLHVLFRKSNMKFENDTWKVKQLLDLYKEGKLNLSPPYQRNPIWTKKAQILCSAGVAGCFACTTGAGICQAGFLSLTGRSRG